MIRASSPSPYSLYKLLIILLLISVGAACSDSSSSLGPEDEDPTETDPGNVDFSTFITIGNSLTAGMMDAALYDESQYYSLGAVLARQLQPDAFNQPDIRSENGYNTLFSTDDQIFGRLKLDPSATPEVPSPTLNGDPITDYTGDRSALHNFGVNGIQVGDLLDPDLGVAGSETFNRYYERFASEPGVSTILGDAINADPTFFMLWIGSNDILRYITSGGTNPDHLTDPADFQRDYRQVIESLMNQTSAKGLVATIPQILEVPLLTTIPYNVVELDPITAGFLNVALEEYNEVLDLLVEHLDWDPNDIQRRKVEYSAGNNPVFMTDPGLASLAEPFDQLLAAGLITGEERETLRYYEQARPMITDPVTGPERVMLTAFLVLGSPGQSNPSAPLGVAEPLPPQYTISIQELKMLEERRLELNQIIRREIESENSDSIRIALYDTDSVNSVFTDLFGIRSGQKGTLVQGEYLEADFGINGVFSTDGVHPNARGNGLIVNDFIDTIEFTFESVIPRVDVLKLPGVALCEGDCLSNQEKKVSLILSERIESTLNMKKEAILEN